MSVWPLTCVLVRLLWLRALCGVAEGASTKAPDAAASANAAASECVAAWLGDAQKRLCILGGRSFAPRSLGSVLGSYVTRFLGGFRGNAARSIPTQGIASWSSGVAVTRDGSTLLVADTFGKQCLHIFCLATGVHVRTVGSQGGGLLQFRSPRQISIASDGFVFVADYGNHRVQVLTPRFEFHSPVGQHRHRHRLDSPTGVCADDAVIAVLHSEHRISVISRASGTLLRFFGHYGVDAGALAFPLSLCFTGRHSCIAVADRGNDRISLFSLDGAFVRSIGAGKLGSPVSVACSDSGDEFVVANEYDSRITVLSASGELLHVMPGDTSSFTGVALHGSFIFAQTFNTGHMVFA